MPVVARCPRCQAMLAGTGKRERCLRCGEMVIAVFRKLCSRCARDVTSAPRLKNASGEYYCQPCWLEVCEAEGKEPAYQCGECGELFSDDQVYQEKTQYICKKCFAARADPAGAAVEALSGLAEAEESPESGPLGYVPSYYATTARARSSAKMKRERLITILSLVGATILIVVVTILLVWYRSS